MLQEDNSLSQFEYIKPRGVLLILFVEVFFFLLLFSFFDGGPITYDVTLK